MNTLSNTYGGRLKEQWPSPIHFLLIIINADVIRRCILFAMDLWIRFTNPRQYIHFWRWKYTGVSDISLTSTHVSRIYSDIVAEKLLHPILFAADMPIYFHHEVLPSFIFLAGFSLSDNSCSYGFFDSFPLIFRRTIRSNTLVCGL